MDPDPEKQDWLVDAENDQYEPKTMRVRRDPLALEDDEYLMYMHTGAPTLPTDPLVVMEGRAWAASVGRVVDMELNVE